MKFLIGLISSIILSIFESNGWVVVEFPQVKQLYTIERAKYNGPDPFFRKGPKELKRYCDELRMSGIYSMWTSKEPVPPMVIASYVPASAKLNNEPNYRYQKAVNVNERYPIPMFSCLKHSNEGYWYLSYGFNDDYLFIFANIEPSSKGSGLEIKGLLEKSPKVDRNVQRGSGLEIAFWNAMTGNRSPLPVARGKSSHLFRLCSLVVDSIRNTYSLQKTYTINFGLEYVDQTPSPVSRPVMFQFLKNKKNLQVEAIPCAINRGFKRPNFFITPDPDDQDSVFVLLENEDLMDSQTKYVVKYYVRDVSALRNWSQF